MLQPDVPTESLSLTHALWSGDCGILKGGNSHDIPTFVFSLSGDKPPHAPVLYLQPQGTAFLTQRGIIKSEFTFGNEGLLNLILYVNTCVMSWGVQGKLLSAEF